MQMPLEETILNALPVEAGSYRALCKQLAPEASLHEFESALTRLLGEGRAVWTLEESRAGLGCQRRIVIAAVS